MAERQDWAACRLVTSTKEGRLIVHGWRVAWTKDPDVVIKGNSLDSLINRLAVMKATHIVMINLDMEGRAIIEALAARDWKPAGEVMHENTFKALITDRNKMITLRLRGKRGTVTLLDLMRVIPIAPKELEPIVLDGDRDWRISDQVNTVARALRVYAVEMNLRRSTISANAYFDFLDTVTRRQALRWFPQLTRNEYNFARSAFHGGIVYLKKEAIGQDIGQGISVDANSLYPSVALSNPLPVGRPRHFETSPEDEDFGSLWIGKALIDWTLKPDGIPCIPRKYWTAGTRGEESGYPVEVVLTSVDYELLQENYTIDVLEWRGGLRFMGFKGIFDKYVNKWGALKKSSEGGERMVSKLMLNSLFGKMGAKNERQNTIVEINENREATYKLGEIERTRGIYAPVAAFITAYGRRELVHAMQANRDRIIYADTDSMHLTGQEPPAAITLDETEFGCWKVEETFEHMRHVREKAYSWIDDDGFHCKCSGMPSNIRNAMTWDTFKAGWTNYDKETGEIIEGLGRTIMMHDGGRVKYVDQKFTIIGDE